MYLVTYDITEPGRLRRVAKVLKRYGLRVQKSVFECEIDERLYKELRTRLERILKDDDSILCYRLFQSTQKEELGSSGCGAKTK